MALDESVRRNPTQPVNLLEREGHLLLVSGGTRTHVRSHQMRWEVNAYTDRPPWHIIKESNNMIGCTWLNGRGLLSNEASAHSMWYVITSIYTAGVNSSSTKPNVYEAYPEKKWLVDSVLRKATIRMGEHGCMGGVYCQLKHLHTSCYIYLTSIYTADLNSTSTKLNVHKAYPEKKWLMDLLLRSQGWCISVCLCIWCMWCVTARRARVDVCWCVWLGFF